MPQNIPSKENANWKTDNSNKFFWNAKVKENKLTNQIESIKSIKVHIWSVNFVPSYSWGGASGFTTYLTSKAFQTAKIVMARRQIEFSEEDAKIMEHVFEITKKYRKE